MNCHRLAKIFISLTLLVSSALSAQPVKIGIVLDKGGRNDRSFNESALAGLKRAEKELGVEVKDVVAADDNSFEHLLQAFARKGFDLVIGVGFAQKESVSAVATKFPAVKFALIDAETSEANVRSIVFREQEGAFIVGAAAALKSKSGVIGFIGGIDVPLIRKFLSGYEAGARHINPKIKVIAQYVGLTGAAWNDPARAKELAQHQIAGGADVIFQAAGASGMGVFDAVEERNAATKTVGVLAIGTDANQNWIKPGHILTSMLKRVDEAVFSTVKDLTLGQFKGGKQLYTLKNQGLDYARDEHNRALIDDAMAAKLDAIKDGIVTGKIAVDPVVQAQK